MDELKRIAKALGLDPESPVETILDAIETVQKKAVYWEGEAKDNLAKMVRTDSLLRESENTRAENIVTKASGKFRITKAEADEYKKIILEHKDGEKIVERLLAARSDNEYMMIKSSLDSKPEPGDPIVEIESRANELVAKSGGKISKGQAMLQVKKSDPELSARYDAAIVKGGSD